MVPEFGRNRRIIETLESHLIALKLKKEHERVHFKLRLRDNTLNFSHSHPRLCTLQQGLFFYEQVIMLCNILHSTLGHGKMILTELVCICIC